MSWNVLAHCYMVDRHEDLDFLPRDSPLWDFSARCELLLAEVAASRPDVLCLQEVKGGWRTKPWQQDSLLNALTGLDSNIQQLGR